MDKYPTTQLVDGAAIDRDNTNKLTGSGTLTLNSAVSGSLIGFLADGSPLVDFPANPAMTPLSARSFVTLNRSDVGSDIVLLFDEGDVHKPLVIAVAPIRQDAGSDPMSVSECSGDKKEIEFDGTTMVVTASESITLRCGAASLTLMADGTILIRGSYLQSRSSGVNRILGGTVQIN